MQKSCLMYLLGKLIIVIYQGQVYQKKLDLYLEKRQMHCRVVSGII